MKAWLQKNYRIVFYVLWALLLLIQASLTELQDDEAYYWVYSKYLDWGYFDHPPMIALLVKGGYAIFPNELGVRLLPLLLNILTILLIERLTGKKNPILFFAIVLSIVVLQLGGFMAVPDIPLIFFTALFFYCYQNFLGKENFFNCLMMGISIALLFYSKYHGVLVVFFTLLSNLRLLKSPWAWLSGIIAMILFAPHLWWQYEHNWVSFRYHLFESNVHAYKIAYTAEYLLGQLFMPGPIAGFILLPAAFLYKPRNPFDKALQFTLAGVLLFFLLSTFRGRVEANWTSPSFIPLILLSYKYLEQRIKWRTLLFKLVPVSIAVSLFGRIVMLEDILPIRSVRERYHAWKDWPAVMKEKTKGLPVVFGNYYQYASKYWFYTGQVSFAQSFYKVRKNNYNFWPVEDSVLGKPVFVLDKHRLYLFPNWLKTPLGYIGFKYDSCFPTFPNLKINVHQQKFAVKQSSPFIIHFNYTVPGKYSTIINNHLYPADTTVIGVFNQKGWVLDIPTRIKLSEMKDQLSDSLVVAQSLPPGNYVLRFALHVGKYYPAHTSDNFNLKVE
jgi:hypothetical protein